MSDKKYVIHGNPYAALWIAWIVVIQISTQPEQNTFID